MLSNQGPVEGEGGWKRIASQLEAEVNRLHAMLEATQNTNLELERQSNRLTRLEGGTLPQQQRDGYPQFPAGNNDEQTGGLLSPMPPMPQGPSQHRMEAIYLPRPHSRSSSPVVSRMTGPPPAQVQGFLPGSAMPRPGAAEVRHQSASRASLRSVQAQLSQQDLDAARGQAAWHERERHKAALQVTRLSDELEAARAEAARLKQQLHDRDRHWGGQEQTWTQVREEARERQERFDALAAERAELVTRVGVLEKEKVEMRQHITKLDMYLVNVARELDEVRDARCEMEERVRRLKGSLTASEAQVALLNGELQGLAKGVTRVLGSRKGLDATYAKMGGLLERLRSMGLQEAVVDMARHGGERGGAHLEKWVASVRRMATEAHNLTTQLGQEVDAGRRESELVAGDLNDLLTRVQRALGKAAGKGAEGQGEGDDRGLPLSDRLRRVDDQAEETGRHLRELLRGRVASLQAQLREACEARADVEAENERLGKEARGSAARLSLLQDEEERLRREVEALTAQLHGLVSERRAAGDAMQVHKAELGDLRPRLTSAEKEAAHLRESLEQLRLALSAAVGEKKAAVEERDAMAELLGTRTAEVEGLGRRVEELEWEVDEASKALGGGQEEVGALRAALARTKSGTARVVDRLVEQRERASKASVLGAWAAAARQAGLRRWRLRLLGRMAGVVRGQHAEEERLRAEVEEGEERRQAMEGEAQGLRQTVEELRGHVQGLERARQMALQGLVRKRTEAEMREVMQAWAREVRGQVEARRAFVEAFRRHVAGKRARGWRQDREELTQLRERMEVWSREGVPPEERARIEGEVEALGKGLEHAQAQVQAYAEELQQVRSEAEERVSGLEEQVERERSDARLLREDAARLCREAEARAEGLQDELQAVGAREEQLRQHMADQQASVQELQTEIEGLEKRLTEAGEAGEGLRRQLEELREEGRRREEAVTQSKREWEEAMHQQRLEAEVARMSAWQDAEVKIGTGLRERLASVEGEREAARAEAQQLRDEVRKGEEERHRYGLRQRELEMVVKATREEYVRLQQALASAGNSPGKGGERGGESGGAAGGEGSRVPIFSSYGFEGEEEADVAEMNARLARSEAGRAELTRQLEDARAEIARLKQELAALMPHKPTDGEGPLRRRIEELQQQVDEGRKEVMRLRQGLSAGEGKEERMHALSREMELLSAARQQLQDTVNMQQNEIARLVEQSRVAEGRLSTQTRRLEALEQEREAGEALRHSQDGVLRGLRDKVATLSRENENLRTQLERAREAGKAGGAAPAHGHTGERAQDVLHLSGASDASLRQSLEASQAENHRLRQALHSASAEREEFSQLCQTLRDEMLAVAGTTPGAHHLSPMVLRTNQGGGADAPHLAPSPMGPHTGSAYVSPTQVESFRMEVQAKEREVEKLRNELQRELALRRELEEEGERARDEREERARVIARELGEAMRQRDQAAHTAHSLETALKCSQERIDYLIRENSSIKDGLKALEKKIVAHPSHAAPPRRPRLVVPPAPAPDSDDDSLLFADSPKARARQNNVSSEPEWSPSSNAARRAWDDSQGSDKPLFHDKQDTSGTHGHTPLFDHSTGEEADDPDGPLFPRRTTGGRRSRSPSMDEGSSDDGNGPQRRQQYELASSCGGRAFLVASSRPSSKSQDKTRSPVQTPQAPGEGARLEVLRMLHSAEAEVQATLSRQLPVDPALKDYIHELKDALRRLEEAEDLHPRQSN